MKGSKYTFSIARRIFRLSSFIPYDPKLSTYMDKQFLFYKISNLQKREKDVTVMPSGHPCRGYCHDTRITLVAQAKRIGALETRIKIDITVIILIRSCAVRSALLCLRGSFRVRFRTKSVASNLQTNLFIATRCVSFSTSLFFFNILVFILWG